ncbi:MAG TPA: sigma-70 family RNA polymerase sigma factor [Polyangiales bacterium]|nr:sigma-70 family RNA polymerase sigma factor [Polyangiales bacterium]
MIVCDDEDLVARWSRGDRRAGQDLYNRHFAAVRDFFRGRAAANVDELVQQTFFDLVQALQRYRGDSSVRTFILSIARNKLYEHYRKASRSPAADLSVSSLRDPRTSPSRALARRQESNAVSAAMQSIPRDMQIALELMYREGLSPVEIATALELPLNTVYSRIHRARALLRDRLMQEL